MEYSATFAQDDNLSKAFLNASVVFFSWKACAIFPKNMQHLNFKLFVNTNRKDNAPSCCSENWLRHWIPKPSVDVVPPQIKLLFSRCFFTTSVLKEQSLTSQSLGYHNWMPIFSSPLSNVSKKITQGFFEYP